MPTRSNSSTTVAGHKGTGWGQHTSDWVHYKSPKSSDDRQYFTKFEYNTANTYIQRHMATKKVDAGVVRVPGVKWKKKQTVKCQKCNLVWPTHAPPDASARCNSSKFHSLQMVNEWVIHSQTDFDLYYRMINLTIQVSVHG